MKNVLVFVAMLSCLTMVVSEPSDAQQDRTEPLRVLEQDQGQAAALALRDLLSSPERVAENLVDVLTIAHQVNGSMDTTVLLPTFGTTPYWGRDPHIPKGDVILGYAAESVRNIEDDEMRAVMRDQLQPFVIDGIAGDAPGLTPSGSMAAYYYSAFPPEGVYIVPRDLAAARSVLEFVANAVPQDDTGLGQMAASLLTSAAYLMPADRAAILDEIEALAGEDYARSAKDMVAQSAAHQGEPVSYAAYEETRGRTDDELLELVLSPTVQPLVRRTNLRELATRLETSASRDEMLDQLLGDSAVASRYWGLFVPRAVPEEAPEQDRALIDAYIQAFSRQLDNATQTDAHSMWKLSALKRLMSRSQPDERKGLQSGIGGRTRQMSQSQSGFVPHGRGEIVDLVIEALDSDDAVVVTAAIDILKDTAWASEDLARRILSVLLAAEDRLESQAVVQSVDGAAALGERIRESLPRELDQAIQEVQLALESFSGGSPTQTAAVEPPESMSSLVARLTGSGRSGRAPDIEELRAERQAGPPDQLDSESPTEQADSIPRVIFRFRIAILGLVFLGVIVASRLVFKKFSR